MDKLRRFHGKPPRVAVAAALATGMLALFAALGGAGLAQDAISASQYQYGKKVTICHKGKTITVSKSALPAHQRHGDTIGPCSSSAAKAKGEKVKAAKVKAANAKADKANPAKGQSAQAPGRGKGK